MKIFVVGAGMGGEPYLTLYAREIIKNADIVLSAKRLHGLIGGLNRNSVLLEMREFLPFIAGCESRGVKQLCVLVSGDVGFYSFARTLAENVKSDIEFVSGINCMQYLAAKLGISYDDAVAVSVHGRDIDAVPYVCYNKKVFLLTGGDRTPRVVLRRLNDSGLGFVSAFIGENLSEPGERVTSGTVERLCSACADVEFSGNSAMFIVNDEYVNSYEAIPDGGFMRGGVPMTKQAVRALALARLSAAPGDAVADIGAGTGAMSVELARRARAGTVYAVESEDMAAGLIRQNIKKHGAYNVELIAGRAPGCFGLLPRIDKAFVGGSGGLLCDIIAGLLENNAGMRIAVTAVALETLAAATDAFRGFGLKFDVACINAANAVPTGRYHLMKAENPVYLIVGERRRP